MRKLGRNLQLHQLKLHQRNLEVLVTKIFKLRKDIAPDIMKEVSGITEPFYNFRSKVNHFKRENIRTTHYCIQSIRHLGPKIWDLVPKL